jgi:alkyl hydroperoxide reductase subunit AhpC
MDGAVLAPKDFTPVCTTEIGYMAKVKPQFDRRNVKVIGLSVDPVGNHARWASDIEQTQGQAPNYPIIGDAGYKVSKLYGMLPATTSGDPLARTPADNQTVRNVFVVGPDKKVKLVLVYPMTTGRNFDEVLRVIDPGRVRHPQSGSVQGWSKTPNRERSTIAVADRLTGLLRRYTRYESFADYEGP